LLKGIAKVISDARGADGSLFSSFVIASARKKQSTASRTRKTMNGTIHFFAPGLKHYDVEGLNAGGSCGLVAVSVTGTGCALNCKHCGRSILRAMAPTPTPEALLAEGERAAAKGAPGLLISGGSLPDGSVPLEPFFATMKTIREELDLPVLVHTGLVHPSTAKSLAWAGVDCVMLDIIGHGDTIREVCQLSATVEDYDRSLRLLAEAYLPIAPHLIMGLHFGQIVGEVDALDIIAGYPVRAVVMAGFRPIPGTKMEHVRPLAPESMGELFREARERFPHTPVLLGCERPLGPHRERTDLLALDAGLDGIAFPSEEAIKFCRERNMTVHVSRTCCSMIRGA
jgi:lipoyl synthase